MTYYDRDGNPCTVEKWMLEFDDNQIKVSKVNGYVVSTVYLGIDHSFGSSSAPLIYETMIFGDGALNEWCQRHPTKEAALAGHAFAVEMVTTNAIE